MEIRGSCLPAPFSQIVSQGSQSETLIMVHGEHWSFTGSAQEVLSTPCHGHPTCEHGLHCTAMSCLGEAGRVGVVLLWLCRVLWNHCCAMAEGEIWNQSFSVETIWCDSCFFEGCVSPTSVGTGKIGLAAEVELEPDSLMSFPFPQSV